MMSRSQYLGYKVANPPAGTVTTLKGAYGNIKFLLHNQVKVPHYDIGTPAYYVQAYIPEEREQTREDAKFWVADIKLAKQKCGKYLPLM